MRANRLGGASLGCGTITATSDQAQAGRSGTQSAAPALHGCALCRDMGTSEREGEQNWSRDEGQRINIDEQAIMDIETGLQDNSKVAANVNDGDKKGKNNRPSTSIGDIPIDCRYCLLSDTPANLVAPCGCAGTQRWCHYKCLKHWVQEKRTLACEICGKPYIDSIRTELASIVTKVQKREQERSDVVLEAQLQDIANNPASLPTNQEHDDATIQLIRRVWCRILVAMVVSMILLYAVLLFSQGFPISFSLATLLRVFSLVIPFYLIGRGIIALRTYNQ